MYNGSLFTFYKDPYCKIPVFVMGGKAERCVLWVGGQSESFLNFGYFPKLAEMLTEEWAFVQTEVASSRIGFGAQDHVHDAEDMDDLISILVKDYGIHEIALFGTSTGVQIVFELLDNSRNIEFITRVILYGVVCDPESPLFTPEGNAAREELVSRLIAEGRQEDSRALLDHYDIPITPARLSGAGFPTLQEAVWSPCLSGDVDTLRRALNVVKVPMLVMLAHHAQYKPTEEEIQRVIRLVKDHAGCTHVTVSYFNDTCDERRRVLKAAEDEHVNAIIRFLIEEDEKRAIQEEQRQRKAVEDEKKRKSVLQASAFANNVARASTV
ncbi:putative radial spoke protein 3 [Trypanosoma grayi]|uniref:putative radial spoke protein 3 n=1 Tax=Trypanosoma grayi TaxID=71804 RepID=UPI0004F45F3F|nr:putative radial spoke protein 3 [Trypanosoma grayi]KEG12822.1 putative radial spoke protein 3 [Trypanosoma grayi]